MFVLTQWGCTALDHRSPGAWRTTWNKSYSPHLPASGFKTKPRGEHRLFQDMAGGLSTEGQELVLWPFNLDHPADTTGLLTTGNHLPSAMWHVVRVSLLEAVAHVHPVIIHCFQLPLCKEPGWIHFLQTQVDIVCSARLCLTI